MKRYCLTLDLKNDAELIKEYETYHREFRPEIKESITVSGIINMDIYRLDNRLFMIMETDDNFTFEKLYWPVTSEYWQDEFSKYKVILNSGAQKIYTFDHLLLTK